MRKKSVKSLLILFFIGFYLSFSQDKWWWLSSIYEMKEWYPLTGVLFWWLRLLVFLVLIFYFIYLFSPDFKFLFKKNFTPYFIFILFTLFSLLLKNHHPFSNMPVYTSFPDKSYVYLIEDEEGRLFNHGLSYQSADIVDIYDAYLETEHKILPLTVDEKEEIGKRIISFVRERNNKKNQKKYRVLQRVNYLVNDSLYSYNVILYDENN